MWNNTDPRWALTGRAVSVDAVVTSDGFLHVVAVAGEGSRSVYHQMRDPRTGAWTRWCDIIAVMPSPPGVVQDVSVKLENFNLVVTRTSMTVGIDGKEYTWTHAATRRTDGSWTNWAEVK